MRMESTSSTIANVVAALDLVLERGGHVVAEVVEAELVVGAVGDVGGVRRALRVEVVDLGQDHADLEPEEAGSSRAHPLGVALGEIVVDGDEVHAVAGERVEVRAAAWRRGSCPRRSSSPRPTRSAAPRRPSPGRRSGAGRACARRPRAPAANASGRRSSRRSARVVVLLGLIELLAEREREAAEVVVGARLHLGLEAVDDRRDRLQHLELLALTGMQQLVEEAHTAINATGGPIVPGPGRRTIPRHVLRPRWRGAVTGGTHTAGSVGPVGDRAHGRRDRRDRVAARHHARRGAGRSDRRRRRAALPGARGGGRRARARRTPRAGDTRVDRRGSRRDLPVRSRDPRALGIVVPAYRDRARPGLPHRVDHEVRGLRRTRRLRVQGAPALLPAAVLLAARPLRGADRHATPTRRSRSACSSPRS